MATFVEGLSASLNPFSFLGVLLFAVFLGRYVYSTFEVIFLGGIFVVFSFYTQYVILMGQFDPFFRLEGVEKWLQFSSLVIAAFFLFKGGRHFVLWNKWNNESLKKDSPAMSFVLSGRSKCKNIYFCFFKTISYFVFLGVFISFLKGLWTQEYYLLLDYYYLVSDGKIQIGVEMILKYLLGFNFLSFGVWFFCIWVVCSENFKCFLREQYSLRNMLNSAFFIAGGIGLIYGNLVKFNII